jgi:L-lactate dehydrogenase complex protein LldG
MSDSREKILARLRAARRPFPDAPPRPGDYLPVTVVDDLSPEALTQHFKQSLEALKAHVHVVEGDIGARAKVLELLREYHADHVLAWDFRFIPVEGLQNALEVAGIRVTFPDLHAENRADHANLIKEAGAGLIGVDAAAASTGTLIVSTAPGKPRAPSVLPPVLIAVVAQDQLLPRLESWLERERANGMPAILGSANVAFITGPSRTGDIEMELVLGVHGPGIVHAIVKQ